MLQSAWRCPPTKQALAPSSDIYNSPQAVIYTTYAYTKHYHSTNEVRAPNIAASCSLSAAGTITVDLANPACRHYAKCVSANITCGPQPLCSQLIRPRVQRSSVSVVSPARCNQQSAQHHLFKHDLQNLLLNRATICHLCILLQMLDRCLDAYCTKVSPGQRLMLLQCVQTVQSHQPV